MKIWNSYGSEHSMNLVMIGKFESSKDAKKVNDLIEKLISRLPDIVEVGSNTSRYSDEVMDLLKEVNCYILTPIELEQFSYDSSIEVKGEQIILTTDESDVSAYLKLFIDNGAKVEVYSAHEHPDEDYGRGK